MAFNFKKNWGYVHNPCNDSLPFPFKFIHQVSIKMVHIAMVRCQYIPQWMKFSTKASNLQHMQSHVWVKLRLIWVKLEIVLWFGLTWKSCEWPSNRFCVISYVTQLLCTFMENIFKLPVPHVSINPVKVSVSSCAYLLASHCSEFLHI